MKIKVLLSLSLLIVASANAVNMPHTQFTISVADLESLSNVHTTHNYSIAELKYWDDAANDLAKRYPLGDGGKQRLKAYLFSAQADFAKLSTALKNKGHGSFSPISAHVLQIFFPSYKPDPTIPGLKDPYSILLANILLSKIKERYTAESKKIKPYQIKLGPDYWQGEEPFTGLSCGNMTPWFMSSSDQFRSPQPPQNNNPFWKEQAEAVLKEVRAITPQRKQMIDYWAPADWQQIAEDYMEQDDTSLEKRLEVRSVLSRALMDATIACFDCKYTYWIKRPFMVLPTIKNVISCPNHPSFPAGHALGSKTAATVLKHYFPSDTTMWDSMADESSSSRIWAGLHFPIDLHVGQEIGSKVGELALNKATPGDH